MNHKHNSRSQKGYPHHLALLYPIPSKPLSVNCQVFMYMDFHVLVFFLPTTELTFVLEKRTCHLVAASLWRTFPWGIPGRKETEAVCHYYPSCSGPSFP